MSYLEFDKKELINLEYSLNRELLRTNRAGSYASYTLVGCNTRKYHGLLVCPMEHLDGDKHVLLSSMDLSIVHEENEFNLGIHKYSGDVYIPRGHKYVQDFQADIFPKIYYRIGGLRVSRESVLVEKEQQILIKYTILEAEKPLKLKFTPFLAFRNMHQLSKANMHVNTKVKYIDNGIKMRLYDGYAWLYMQFSKKVDFVHVPDWYYSIEYSEEQNRGYEYSEDLFVPGYFETTAKPGDSIVFSASTELSTPSNFKRKLTAEVKKRIPRDNFKNCLLNSAEQFIIRIGKRTEVIAGYPWYGCRTRDALISLSGLTLTRRDTKTFTHVIDTVLSKLRNGLLPDLISDDEPTYNSVDASLWLFWALQQYTDEFGKKKEVWTSYGRKLKSILKAYKKGIIHNIHVQHNGLVYAGIKGSALTWMDSIVQGKAVTPRMGCPVEVNALWYNAVCYALELAKVTGDSAFTRAWSDVPRQFEQIFIDSFWSQEKGYLADVVDGTLVDWTVRPNQVIAASMSYSPLNMEMKNSILDNAKRFLLTPRGLRSLAPRHPDYKGVYSGNSEERDYASHQGSVWPWLLEHFVETHFQVHKKAGVAYVKKLVEDFAPVMDEHGIGSISELYDGNPPHLPRGAISQAESVAALLRIIEKIEKIEE